MIKVCFGDNHTIVHFGIESCFKDHRKISIVANVKNFQAVQEILFMKEIDILILNLQLEGLSSILELKSILKKFSKTKIILYGDILEQFYVESAIKIGISGFVCKTEKVEILEQSILLVNQGHTFINDAIRTNID
jgi:DNA-binding NarL/FixJ family response regulator